MTLPGECVNDTETKCMDCQTHLKVDVQHSVAGYYIGFFCPNCGPYSRESGYYRTIDEARKALDQETYFRI